MMIPRDFDHKICLSIGHRFYVGSGRTRTDDHWACVGCKRCGIWRQGMWGYKTQAGETTKLSKGVGRVELSKGVGRVEVNDWILRVGALPWGEYYEQR